MHARVPSYRKSLPEQSYSMLIPNSKPKQAIHKISIAYKTKTEVQSSSKVKPLSPPVDAFDIPCLLGKNTRLGRAMLMIALAPRLRIPKGCFLPQCIDALAPAEDLSKEGLAPRSFVSLIPISSIDKERRKKDLPTILMRLDQHIRLLPHKQIHHTLSQPTSIHQQLIHTNSIIRRRH